VYWLEEYRNTDHLNIFDKCGVMYGNIEKLHQDYQDLIM